MRINVSVVIVALVALGACGEQDTATQPAPTVTVTETATPSPEPSAESVEAPPTETSDAPTPEPPATWGPFVASSKPGIQIVASGYETLRGMFSDMGYPGVGAIGYNNGPEHFSINVTFQVLKDGFVAQSTSETVAYIPPDSFFAVGSQLEKPVDPGQKLKVTYEPGSLVEEAVPADIDVEARSLAGNVAIQVRTDTKIPKGSSVYLVYVNAAGDVIGGESNFTNVTMMPGKTTNDSLDALHLPKAATEIYVTMDRLAMM